jgi:hypothetical protein
VISFSCSRFSIGLVSQNSFSHAKVAGPHPIHIHAVMFVAVLEWRRSGAKFQHTCHNAGIPDSRIWDFSAMRLEFTMGGGSSLVALQAGSLGQ